MTEKQKSLDKTEYEFKGKKDSASTKPKSAPAKSSTAKKEN